MSSLARLTGGVDEAVHSPEESGPVGKNSATMLRPDGQAAEAAHDKEYCGGDLPHPNLT